MKPVLAWAIVENGGELAVYDFRLPLTWLRRQAAKENKEKCIGGRVIRVEVREFSATRVIRKRHTPITKAKR